MAGWILVDKVFQDPATVVGVGANALCHLGDEWNNVMEDELTGISDGISAMGTLHTCDVFQVNAHAGVLSETFSLFVRP